MVQYSREGGAVEPQTGDMGVAQSSRHAGADSHGNQRGAVHGIFGETDGHLSLVSDPHLYGGGLHQIQRGGSLGFHADHNINPRVELYRRVSVILYLNDGWKEEYGGQLEMWSADMTHCVDTITPVLGRLAIFSNSETSFHGHPDVLQRPEGMTRKSIAAYFDSIKPDPSYSTEQHRALFQERRIS